MAELISEREIASTQLFTFELSAGELEAVVACLNFLLTHASDGRLETVTGAYRDELEAIRDDLNLRAEDESDETTMATTMSEPA